MMNNEFRARAETLAKQPYITLVLREKTTDGDWMYLALNPELEGCMAQGETVEAAEAFLDEFRVDYIQSLLADGLPVPTPQAALPASGEPFTSVTLTSAPDSDVQPKHFTEDDAVLTDERQNIRMFR